MRASDGTLRTGRSLPGRGAWLCRASPDCLTLAVRRNAFPRALRGPVAAGAAEALTQRGGA